MSSIFINSTSVLLIMRKKGIFVNEIYLHFIQKYYVYYTKKLFFSLKRYLAPICHDFTVFLPSGFDLLHSFII